MAESHEVATGRDLFFQLLEEESRLMLDPATGRLREDWAKELACPLCDAAADRELFVKDGLRFVQCDECGLVYMNPRLNAGALERLYARASEANDAWVDVLLSEAEEAFQNEDFGTLLDWVDDYGGGGRMLDVGCSVGRLLQLARQRGYEGLGLEPGRRAARHARNAWGLDVREVLLEDAGLPAASFDFVAAVEVLEHVPDPRAMLAEVRRVLRPGGLFLAGVPNMGSLGVMALGPEARTFNRNHLVYYDRTTLTRLLGESGFEVLDVATAVSLLDSILNRVQGVNPFSSPRVDGLSPALRRLLADDEARGELEDGLCEAGLGYRLRVLARRA